MRTTPLIDVFNRLVRMHGRNPKASVNDDMRDALVEHINSRASTICKAWRWPEWELTEERAFRQIWNTGHQYKKISDSDGKPDEVFYLGDGFLPGEDLGDNFGYYRINPDSPIDPPAGTAPSDADFWVSFSPVDTFIAYDQTCRRAIGMVLGVYSQNPRVPTGSANGLMDYAPSEKGVDVRNAGVQTVFVSYKLPVPKYTMIPFVVGKIYRKGDVAFDPTTGECFQALDVTNAFPADTNFWRRVPFLQAWEDYVCQGSFADSLMEFDQSGAPPSIPLVQYWNQQADDSFQQEVDALVIQGQRLRWDFCKQQNGCWCTSQPWTGGIVTTLSDACEDELGWVFTTISDGPAVRWEYRFDVVALLTVDGTPSLQNLVTANYFLPGSRVIVSIIPAGGSRTRIENILVAGPADAGDPGHVRPDDYNASTNNVHWEKDA